MNQVGSVEIVIKGGRPWGFTLQGGIESRSALTVAQIEPRGKAERHGALKVGDHVLKINDVQCFSLVDATQLIDCAFRTLTVLVWRSKSVVSLPCNQIRETVKYAGSRQILQLDEDKQVVRRTSAAIIGKILPLVINKDHTRFKSHESLTKKTSPEVTLTCDSHESWSESLESSGPRSLGSSTERSPLLSSCHSLALSKSTSVLYNPDRDQDIVFQTHDSSNRYPRSPRNLTKDSGYETSAQTEHDYVNVEWINRTPHSSPLGYPVPKKSTTSNKVSDEHYPGHSAEYSYCQNLDLERSDDFTNGQHRATDSNSGLSYYSECNESGTSPAPSFHRRTGSYSSLYSSSESLSSRSSKLEASRIRPAKSSLSLLSKSGKRSLPPSYAQQVVSSCQYVNRVVNPAQSVPNLHTKREMIPRKTNRKQSIYEELACKSGFDFSPVVQRQSLRVQKQAFEKQDVSDRALDFKNLRSYKREVLGSESVLTKPDKTMKSEIARSYYSPAHSIKKDSSSQQKGDEQSPPPPVPSRDSSLHLHGNLTHEKFPSWPASVPMESDKGSPGQSSGYRSNSWTEQTECAKDLSGAYSRPKKHYQISSQQLPPVQEKGKNWSKKDQFNHGKKESIREGSFSGQKYFDSLSNAFTLDSLYQNTQEVFYPNEKKHDCHSPPEREVALLEKLTNREVQNPTYRQTHDAPEGSKTCDLHENLRTVCKKQPDNTKTPLLDRLRLEKESHPSSWLQKPESDSVSETGTCISSNSSSQETLKWHGSYSDLSSINAQNRNESPLFESDNSTIYEELGPRSIDGSVESYSVLCSSPLGCTVKNNEDIFPQHKDDTYIESETYAHSMPTSLNEPKNTKYCERSSNSYYTAQTTTSNHQEYNRSGSLSPNYCCKNNETFRSQSTENNDNEDIFDVSQSPSGNKSSFKIELNNNPNDRHLSPGFKNNAPQRNKSFSWELKAIQKQAVLSFYHRQTASDCNDKKSPRSSSFSFARGNTLSDKTVPSTVTPRSQIHMKRSLSSSSFDCSKQPAFASVSRDYCNVNALCSPSSEPSSLHSDTIASPRLSSADGGTNDSNLLHKTWTSNSTLDNEQVDKPMEACQKAEDFIRDIERDADNGWSERALKIPITARKAYVKKSSEPNESVIVQILSSQGGILAPGKNEAKNQTFYPSTKPQLPPKRVHKNGLLLPQSHGICNIPLSLPACEKADEEELKTIECNSARNVVTLAVPSAALAPSPDLPLPPPPTIIDTEIIYSDDPFPPPPPYLQEIPTNKMNATPTCFSAGRMTKYFNVSHDAYRYKEPKHTISSVPRASMEIRNCQIPHEETSPDDMPPPYDSSLVVKSASSIMNQTEQKMMDEMEKQGEKEAVYVNVNFGKSCENFAACSLHKSFTAPIPVSVTNTATQTSDETPSLQRKANKRFSRSTDHIDSFFTLSNFKKNDFISTGSDHKDNFLKESTVRNARPVNNSVTLNQPMQSNEKTNDQRCDAGLPLTNPYFTTSEPKAKLLTRYCQSWDKQFPDQMELKGQKDELIASISKKLNILCLEQIELKEEMKENEELGKEVAVKIEKIAKPNEVQKYRIHVEELEKILNLLLSLTGRLARAENALLVLPKDVKQDERDILEAKRNKLSQQHDEAWYLKENIDRRSCQVSFFLHHYLTTEEYADYEHFIKMKSKLLMDAREIDEKIKLGEEQLSALRGTFQTLHVNGE